MCGIAGFVDFKKRSSAEVLKNLTSCLSHRGPDGDGLYFTETNAAQIGLGHKRLSIIDLSAVANQPMHYKQFHIIFNGEIYNYREIRTELQGLGHHFQSHSDTEVILHAWEQWELAAVHKFRGMFSIVLFDEQKQEVACLRDRAGVKPFYYYYHNGLFLFGSELKSLTRHPGFKKELNPEAVASFLQYGYISHPHSIYRNTYKLPPAHILRLRLQDESTSIQPYWNVYDYYNRPKEKISLPDAVTETERILKESFQLRMVADVPVGVFLSGGYDSTCVTALLQSESAEKIKTFTIGATDSKLDEAPYAKEIAARLGTDHTEHYCTPQEALQIIPELPYYYDEPFADSSAIPTILVSRLARKKVTVALSADAGDEIFAGYNRYDYISRYGDKIKSIPKPVRRAMAATMNAIPSQRIPYFSRKSNFHSRYDKFRNLLHNPSADQLMKSLTHVFTNAEIGRLFCAEVALLPTRHISDELSAGTYDDLSYMMAVDYQTYLVDDILQKVDRATMSVSLEGREPFLDQHIIEWAAKLPSEYKYRNGVKKFILRQIVHKYLPKEMMDRPKMGFAIPIEGWLFSELKDLVRENLNKQAIEKHDLFQYKEVEAIVNDFYKGHKEKHLKIWYLLMFQLWYKQWMT